MFVAHDKNHSSMHIHADTHSETVVNKSLAEVLRLANNFYDSLSLSQAHITAQQYFSIAECGAYKIPFNGIECENSFAVRIVNAMGATPKQKCIYISHVSPAMVAKFPLWVQIKNFLTNERKRGKTNFMKHFMRKNRSSLSFRSNNRWKKNGINCWDWRTRALYKSLISLRILRQWFMNIVYIIIIIISTAYAGCVCVCSPVLSIQIASLWTLLSPCVYWNSRINLLKLKLCLVFCDKRTIRGKTNKIHQTFYIRRQYEKPCTNRSKYIRVSVWFLLHCSDFYDNQSALLFIIWFQHFPDYKYPRRNNLVRELP